MNQEEYTLRFHQKKSPLQAIKLHCWDCCGGSTDEVKKCTCKNTCVLYPFRMGKNPFREKRVWTEEQKEAQRNRFKRAVLLKIQE